jgi:ATP-dependent Zn protease
MNNFDWVSLLINWFPMLLLIAVWIWVMRRFQGGTKYRRSYMEQVKKQTELLERVALALEKKTPNG